MRRMDFFIGDKYDPSRHDLMTDSDNGRFVLYSEAIAEIEVHKEGNRRYELWAKTEIEKRDKEMAKKDIKIASSEGVNEILRNMNKILKESVEALQAKLSRLTAALDDNKRVEKVVKNINYLDDYLVESYMKHAINDYRAMLEGEISHE